MRILGLCFFFLVSSAGFAFAQNSSEVAVPQDHTPVYFLVDASGSMRGQKKTDAELLLNALSLPQDRLVSITYFGSKPLATGSNLCFEEFDVPTPTIRSEPFSLDFPELGGNEDQTAITNAIELSLREIKGSYKLIVITDGGEECNKNFSDIRVRYPNANIEIRQVGDSPNAELQKLETPAPPAPPATRWAPTFNYQPRFESSNSIISAWELAGWYERRIWLVTVIGLLMSSWLLGRSFGRRANRYETETKSLETKRHELHQKEDLSEEQLDRELPKKLDEQIIKEIGKPDDWRSIFALCIAVALGVPLILFDFGYPERASWTASVIVFLSLLILLLFVTRMARPQCEKDKKPTLINSFYKVPVTFAFGVVGIGCVIWAFWVDLDAARDASWFVLTARFSGTLAVSASAPILFVGSKWWQYEIAKSNYQHAYTETVSDSIREKRLAEKQVKDDWNTFLMQHRSWGPAIEFTLIGRVARMLDRRASRARGVVIERLKSIAINAGGASASPERNQQLEGFLKSQSVADRIRTYIKSDSTKAQLTPLDDWTALAEALENKNNRQIAATYIKLAGSMAKRSDGF